MMPPAVLPPRTLISGAVRRPQGRARTPLRDGWGRASAVPRRGGRSHASTGDRVKEVAADALEKAGFTAGKKVVFGVGTAQVNPDDIPNDKQRAVLREEASRTLTNIDAEERGRRRLVGNAMLVSSAVLAVLLYVKGVAGIPRFFAVFFPFNLGLGYYKSAEAGL